MGLNSEIALVVIISMIGCAPKNVVIQNKRYVACCDPGLNADDKDMCKWMYENHTNRLRDRAGNTYEGVWDGCESGKERWRDFE